MPPSPFIRKHFPFVFKPHPSEPFCACSKLAHGSCPRAQDENQQFRKCFDFPDQSLAGGRSRQCHKASETVQTVALFKRGHTVWKIKGIK